MKTYLISFVNYIPIPYSCMSNWRGFIVLIINDLHCVMRRSSEKFSTIKILSYQLKT